jgi:hypothetical protein
MPVLEIKAQDSEANRVKRRSLDEWVRTVNGHGGFGVWAADVFDPADLYDILARHAAVRASRADQTRCGTAPAATWRGEISEITGQIALPLWPSLSSSTLGEPTVSTM